MILDGWGIGPASKGNAVYLAKTPFLDKIIREYPSTQLSCSGKAVGLPDGIMGNSEIGHLNIGAGRTVYQNLLRIDTAINNGDFFKNNSFNALISRVLSQKSSLHLIGLASDGGVHSQLSHLFALLKLAQKMGVSNIYIHAILDGRDTSPKSGVNYIKKINDYIKANNLGKIATICGRFYAMDRDNRWDRIEKAYRLYTQGDGINEHDPVAAVKNAYTRDETDEFISPIIITDNNKITSIKNNDGVIFFNFRSDRAREITSALTDIIFNPFKRDVIIDSSDFVCMTRYHEKSTLPVAFPPIHMDNILGEIISNNGLKQFRIAETEKYAHVTYFFNGGVEQAFPNEDRLLIPSPREISTYDQKPEMSAFEVTKKVLQQIKETKYDLIVLNFANMDMVGHTGIVDAAVKACETVDRCVSEIVPEAISKDYTVLITADHGNAEKMINENGQPHTAHTLNPVPFILIDDTLQNNKLSQGSLRDIAPTILDIMGIKKSEEMTGKSLINPAADEQNKK